MIDTEKLCLGCMKEKPDYSPECPYCKFNSDVQNEAKALPLKAELESRYIVGRVVSSNGEGITYAGFDKQQGSAVRIREFFPATHCERINLFVKFFADSELTFASCKEAFLELARALARMRGLSVILPVYDIFEANGTAYYISETVESITLREFLIRNGGSLSFEQMRGLFMPIMSTLSSLHAVDIFHLGISPETLIIGKDGKLRLTDFCISAARTAKSDVPAQLFKGYAAIEQYEENGVCGAWTDVYSLAAVIYRTLVGSPPPDSPARVVNDKLIVPANIAETLTAYVLGALANALQILPGERTRSIEAFRDELSCAPGILNRSIERTQEYKSIVKASGKKEKKASGTKFGILAAVITLVVLVGIGFLVYSLFFTPDKENIVQTTLPTTQTTADYSAMTINPDRMDAPSLVNMKYADVISSSDAQLLNAVKKLKISIIRKEYSDKEKGVILAQSPEAGEPVLKGDTIEIVVSLGNEKFAMPSLKGLTQTRAYIKLLEAGFDADNIKFGEKYDSNAAPKTVVDVTPGEGETVSGDIYVTVFINSYVPKTTATTVITTYVFDDDSDPTIAIN